MLAFKNNKIKFIFGGYFFLTILCFFSFVSAVSAQSSSYTISTDKSTYQKDEIVKVDWEIESSNSSNNDWIGLYKKGSSDKKYESWAYVSKKTASGTLEFVPKSGGEYELRMFIKNSFNKVAETSISVEPTDDSEDDSDETGTNEGDENGGDTNDDNDENNDSDQNNDPENSGEYSVSIGVTEVLVGETFVVDYTTPNNKTSRKDWIGIFELGAGNSKYKAWKYIPDNQTSGSFEFKLNKIGIYEVRLFTNNGFVKVAESDQPLQVDVSDQDQDQDDSDNDGDSDGNSDDTGDDTDGGDNNQDQDNLNYVLTNQTVTAEVGMSVEVKWQAKSGDNLKRDWIGLYKVGASNKDYIAYAYTKDRISGSVSFVIKNSGTYEFRYLKNNGFVSVASSESLVVTPVSMAQCTVYDLDSIINYPPQNGPVIALGDSLTEGVGASGGRDYVSQLSGKIGQEIINAGVSGDTTRDASQRLQSDVLSKNPSVVIVWLGGNDILQRYYEDIFTGAENPSLSNTLRLILLRITGKLPAPQGITEEETFANLIEIIERIQDRGAITIVVGFSGGIFDNDLEEKYKQVADQTNSLYVPNALKDVIGRPTLMSDLVHPNSTGYGIVADRMVPILSCTL
ncbi:hypothetical protein KC845_03770 [Candidatus Kaiserbacteria bacterium]|nr:hypothetical protein [Candidatus Kaiserbacteria bacterium]